MSDFKEMMKQAYQVPEPQDELRFRRMQANIMQRIDRLEERKQKNTWMQMGRVAAMFAIVTASYYFLNQTQVFIQNNHLFAKIDVLVNEAIDQKEDVSTTIISYQTQEDMYVELMHKRLAKLQQSEKEKLLKEIF